MRVKKAIIPAAGLGTRFLPITKSMPKEMLPIIDTPNIQYIVEEAVKSGIEQILIITNQNKVAIENHFDINYELEQRLIQSGKEDLAHMINQIGNLIDINYVRQKKPLGLGHALMYAEPFVSNEPFAVMLGDDLVVNEDKPALLQLLELFDIKQNTILGVQKVNHEDVSKYGIVEPNKTNVTSDRFKVASIVEKPKVENAKSDYAVMGRYILTPDIFDMLRKIPAGANGELQLTDALQKLIENNRPVWACNFEGNRYDIGSKIGFLKANIDFALNRSDLRGELSDYIKELAEKIK